MQVVTRTGRVLLAVESVRITPDGPRYLGVRSGRRFLATWDDVVRDVALIKTSGLKTTTVGRLPKVSHATSHQ